MSSRVAAFHASGRQAILPPGPQVVHGTANDPAPVPEPQPGHGSYHWTFERTIAITLIPLTIAPFAAGSLNPVMDAILVATLIIHSHIGFESVVIDYIPGKRFPKTLALFWWGLRAATLMVAVGFYEFETNDVGITEAIKRVWTA
ncbi:MAG: membrane anchor subunit of succinate dehydrogenase, Sdh4 [Pycnora praestabilis]|nr:MAG: membrane anchor subunit of succinate dehydrogenase, Sdh4 [Pycnora praestabilis]